MSDPRELRSALQDLADKHGLDQVVRQAVIMKAIEAQSLNPRALGINPRSLGINARDLKLVRA